MTFFNKKSSIWILLVVYVLSYFLQSRFFVDAGSLVSETAIKRTHLVAVLVDKDIYKDLQKDIEWYASTYVQSQISGSKAVVLPITTQNFRANEISKMLENMYFDGEKGSTSDLLGVVLLGDIPLPVVQWNGFIYPSIYPYVDFEDQQFVYDANQQYFVYNNKPKAQPEIWHGVVNFGTEVDKYKNFFDKLRTYLDSPTTFVSPEIWYDDFIGMKNTFSTDTLDYYVNNFVFTEDIGYHRFTNTMLDYFKNVQNSRLNDISSGLNTQTTSTNTSSFSDLGDSHVPTMMILSVMKEMLLSYDNLYPGVFLSKMRDNIQAASRWYKKNGSGELVDAVDSHLQKLVTKDVWAIGDIQNGISPLMISFNDQMEKGLDEQIELNKWYMKVPVLSEYIHKDYQNKKHKRRKYCQATVDDKYTNYYFGSTVDDLLYASESAKEMSIYRGTYRNLTTLSGVLIDDKAFYDYSGTTVKTLGASYNTFATQVAGNRGYNLYAAAEENSVYEDLKKPSHREVSCSKWYKILRWKIYCKQRKYEYKNVEDVETPQDFALRNWGGASPLNLDASGLVMDPAQYILPKYDYTNAQLPVYDIGGSTALTGKAEPEANSIKGLEKYSSLIKTQDIFGPLEYAKYVKYGQGAEAMSSLYGSTVYAPIGDGWYQFQGNKVKKNYIGYDFFTLYSSFLGYKSGSNRDYTIAIQLKGGANPIEIVNGNSIGGKCGARTELYVYQYKLVDSRIKNVSPDAEQVNGYDDSPYEGRGIFLKHYTFIQNELSDALQQVNSVSTGAYSSLQDIKSLMQNINQSISGFYDVEIKPANVSLLLSQLAAISSGKQELFSGYVENVEDGVDEFYNLSDPAILISSAETIAGYFDYMKEMDAISGTGTKFLSGWFKTIDTTISSIKTNYLGLSAAYSQLNPVYSSLTSFSYNTAALTAKKTLLNAAQTCTASDNSTYSCGCAGVYKQVCAGIDVLIGATIPYYVGQVADLGNQELEEGKFGNPFTQSISFVSPNAGFDSLDDVNSYIKATIPKVNVVPDAEHKPGLNQTTADRPIDSPRNVTFKGLGGDVLKFTYPNLYEVSVYNKQNGILVLKDIPQIKASIQSYLIAKSKEYNTLLSNQYTKSTTYYQTSKSAFDFLAKASPSLATPANRTQKYLAENYFVTLLGDTNINHLAELLYYQNLPTYSRKQQTYVEDDLASVRSSFDISKKVAYVVSGYLSQHEDWGPVVTPNYNATGYEVAYINSDGADYIAMSAVPEYINSIKARQTAAKTSNTLVEDPILSSNPTYTRTLADCGLDSSYSALLFDLKEKEGKGKMPWITALKCWWSKLPTSLSFSMKFSVGPSPEEFLKSLESSFSSRQSDFQSEKGSSAAGANFSGNMSEYWGSTLGEGASAIANPFTVKKVTIHVPTTSVIAGSPIPVTFSAVDGQNKPVSETMNLFRMSVPVGDGVFLGGSQPSNESEEFSSFDDTTLVYMAPKVTEPTKVTLQFSGNGLVQTKQITVYPASLSVSSSSSLLYKKDTLLKDVSFSLTGIDKTYSTLPRLTIDLASTNGVRLDSPATITSTHGLVYPGLIVSGAFTSVNSYYIDNGTLTIFLMPSFVAGDDEVTIQVPGLDAVTIPVHITTGAPYFVDLKTSKNSLGIKQSLTGSIHVTDFWGNPISRQVSVKIGTMGPLTYGTKTVNVVNGSYDFSLTTTQPGGTAYVYALLNGVDLEQQSPGYQALSVQDSYLPADKLNVLYLNLFGTDWGNQWGYQSDNSGYVARLISQSDKLLAVTTQMMDPAKLKKVDVVATQQAQIKNLSEKTISLSLVSNEAVVRVEGEALISLGSSQNIQFVQAKDESDLLSLAKKSTDAKFIFLPNDTLSGMEIGETTLYYSGKTLIDFKKSTWEVGVQASLAEDMNQGYSVWRLSLDGVSLGSMIFVRHDLVVGDIGVSVFNALQYGSQEVFADGSTNGLKGVGIYDTQAVFEKEGDPSIEDSADYELGLGFTNDFKNVTLWADGKAVGEATIPFASSFLINYGDPLLKRSSDNISLKSVGLDTGIGDQIYSEPGKSIFKVLNTDFNNDGLIDIIVVFTDGTIKILKNYGGNNSYKNLQDLIRLADSIKDVMVGDADGNGYSDLLIWTSSDQLRVYSNDKGVFDVDGKLVCLNTNAENAGISTDPSHISDVQQVYFEDMDKDGKIDIVTNDAVGDIKIFYGGQDSKGRGNYISTLLYTCDPDRYSRQKDTTKLVKNFGIVVNGDQYVQDSSLVHLKGWYMPTEEESEEASDDYKDGDLSASEVPASLSSLVSNSMISSSLSSLVSNMGSLMSDAAYQSVQSEYITSPLQYLPTYEANKTIEDIGYRELVNLSGTSDVAVYKKYQDMNGGSLKKGDQVKINITFSAFNPVNLTYVDVLQGPWEVAVDDANRISSLQVDQGSYSLNNIYWDVDDGQQFVADNIQLAKGGSLTLSYMVTYLGGPLVSIRVKDEQLVDDLYSKKQDEYLDILVSPTDSCKKYRWVFFNTAAQSHRSYDEIFDNIQRKLDAYLSKGTQSGEDLLSSALPKTDTAALDQCSESAIDTRVDSLYSSRGYVKLSASLAVLATLPLPASTIKKKIKNKLKSDCAVVSKKQTDSIMDQISNIPGMSSVFENWNVSSLFSDTNLSNIDLNMSSLDNSLLPVQQKMESLTNSLCQGFKLGKGGCQVPAPFNMIPFNQAFLAPGQYHLFGCTPKAPNPLAPLFKMLNNKLGNGVPVIYFPGTFNTPVGPIPMVGSSFVPIVFQQSPGTDGFGISPGLPPGGGTYPSQLRMYLAPTLTMQLGIAMCFGPYQVGSKIPQPFRDLGGNCVVTAIPLYKGTCGDSATATNEPATEVLDSWMTDLAANGECTNPPQIGRTKVGNTWVETMESPFVLSSKGSNSTYYSTAIQGNLLGFANVSFNDKPTKKTSSSVSSSRSYDDFGFEPYSFKGGSPIDLKILGASAKGLIKSLMQDWFGRQVKYMVNNLTKMTVGITLPDLAQLGEGFNQLSYSDSLAKVKESKASAGTANDISSLKGIKKLSNEAYGSLSDTVDNPFEALQDMFQQVPLVDLHTKDINIKVPMLTSEEILSYSSYLKGWLKNQGKVLRQWIEAINEVMSVCASVTPAEAQTFLKNLTLQQQYIEQNADSEEKQKLLAIVQKERVLYQSIVDNKANGVAPTIKDDAVELWANTKTNFAFISKSAAGITKATWIKNTIGKKKELTDQEKSLLSDATTQLSRLTSCVSFAGNIDTFLKFYVDSSTLVKNVQQNIITLEKYKQFPTQLYQWMHFVDTFMTDLSSFLSNTVFVLMNWMDVNARIYSKYVDALILIVSSIKTWQILIDFSTNRTKKCGKCTKDNYGSYSCSLSFLSPKIPIVPIPPFKIPNIYLDLSHVDLGISLELPKFHFVPIKISLPQLPTLPSPPNINISLGININTNLDLGFGNLSIPNIPLLPEPPVLPELPSFIPKVDLDLPILPPAPKIPNIIPDISSTLNIATTIAKIFCILKKGVGLVGEKGVKAKVEQLTQRTWDVPFFDFFNQISLWKKDAPLKGFDFKVDSYVQFKMNFDGFYGFLDQVVGEVNNFSSSVESVSNTWLNKQEGLASQAMDNFQKENIRDVNVDLEMKTDLNLDLSPLQSAVVDSGIEYAAAYKKLTQGLAYFKKNTTDTDILDQLRVVDDTLKTKTSISPASDALRQTQREIQSIFTEKQKEIRQLATSIKQYPKFLARVERDDVALVSDETIDVSFKVPLFVANDTTKKLLARQESPTKAYLDTNSSLVNRYLNTLKTSSPSDLQMDVITYNKTTSYLQNVRSKIETVYDRLGLSSIGYDSCGVAHVLPVADQQPLLAATTSTSSSSTSSTSTAASVTDISSYVRGIFVEKQYATGLTKENVVKSDLYIDKIGSNYKVLNPVKDSQGRSLDLNRDGNLDVLMWDAHSVYVKYGKQNPVHAVSLKKDTNYYAYDANNWISASWYLDSYDQLLSNGYPNNEGYVDFGSTEVRLVRPNQEVKNFRMVGQDFDTIQFSWQSNESLGEQVGGYLMKLNHRVDTYNDKDQSFNFLDDEFLNKRYVLMLPDDTQYSGATLDFGERYYYKGKNGNKVRDLVEFLPGGDYSGLILTVKYYDPSQENISLSLQEIPRNWQYAQITTLYNDGTTDEQEYRVGAPWSNQIVAGRQLLADTIGPEPLITLQRPKTAETVSTGSAHLGYVGTTYTLNAFWKDNVAVSKMWIQQDDTIVAMITGDQQTGVIKLPGLYFTGATTLNYIFGAEDFNGNKQLSPVTLDIEVPEITVKEFVPLSEISGQLISELSHDIDEGMVVYQRLRNTVRHEISGTLANSFGGFSVVPKQTIVTGSVFSIGNAIGLYDTAGTQIGSLSVDGEMKIFTEYEGRYKIMLDITSSLPVLRVLDQKTNSTLFRVRLSAKELSTITLYQQKPFYDKVDLVDSSFGEFKGGSCIQGADKQCIAFVGPTGVLYIPRNYAQSLQASYYYDTVHRRVNYTIKDFQGKDIALVSVNATVLAQ